MCITAVVLTINSSVRCVVLCQRWLLCTSSLKINYKMTPLGPEFLVFKIWESGALMFQTGPFLCFPSCQLLQLSANLASQLINFLPAAPCLKWPSAPSFSFGITGTLLSGCYNPPSSKQLCVQRLFLRMFGVLTQLGSLWSRVKCMEEMRPLQSLWLGFAVRLNPNLPSQKLLAWF